MLDAGLVVNVEMRAADIESSIEHRVARLEKSVSHIARSSELP
jgi:hypothetical protein